ncbi:MAG: hypothetical protein AB1762_06045 [Gemmatimonadota bacterium]
MKSREELQSQADALDHPKVVDGPAFPIPVTTDAAGGVRLASEFMGCEGLTKRELIAAILMIGLPGRDCANTVEIAIQHADALLERLAERGAQ